MTKIGVYDSGIGGLTTIAKLIMNFQHCDFLLYADNSHFPLGLLDEKKLNIIVEKGIAYLEEKCDFVVLGCNTASCCTASKTVFKLLPPLDDFRPQTTLVLATPYTTKKLQLKERKFVTIDTPELASLITKMYTEDVNQAQILASIENMLRIKLLSTRPPENVLIGCSHYQFIEDTIKKICQKTQLFDGNSKLIYELGKVIPPSSRIGAVDFEFSGENQFDNYASILELLLNAYHKKQGLSPPQ